MQNKKETRWAKIESFLRKIPIFKMQMSNSYWMFPPQPQAGFLPH